MESEFRFRKKKNERLAAFDIYEVLDERREKKAFSIRAIAFDYKLLWKCSLLERKNKYNEQKGQRYQRFDEFKGGSRLTSGWFVWDGDVNDKIFIRLFALKIFQWLVYAYL